MAECAILTDQQNSREAMAMGAVNTTKIKTIPIGGVYVGVNLQIGKVMRSISSNEDINLFL